MVALSSQLGKGRRERSPVAEAYGWLFVDFVPLLYERKRVARQLQVEIWLDLTQLMSELKLEFVNNGKIGQNANVKPKIDYVA